MKLYEQAADHLRIMMLTMKPGERLPSDRELFKKLAMSRGTVLRAVRSLEEQGLIESLHGRGRFVLGPDGERGDRHDAAHERIAREIRHQILDQPDGTAMPHINDLAMTFKVSSVTIRRVMRSLAREGLIHTEHGKAGYFVGAAE